MSNKKGFTLIELVIAIGLFGVGLIAVFVVLNNGFKIMSQARGQVVAINLAREGAETMFNLRDSNLRKRSGKKDGCRLNRKSLFAVDKEKCDDEPWVGYYGGGSEISYFPATAPYGESRVPVMMPMSIGKLDLSNGIGVSDTGYELFVGTSGEFMPYNNFFGSFGTNGCEPILSGDLTTSTSISDCLPQKYSNAGRFFRTITNVGLYDKDPTVSGGNNMQCDNGGSTDINTSLPCGGPEAKELRFCSEVQYIVDSAVRTVDMCSVITNFND